MNIKLWFCVSITAMFLITAACSTAPKGARDSKRSDDKGKVSADAEETVKTVVLAEDLSLQFVSPTDKSLKSNGEVEVEVKFDEKVAPTSTWSLMYGADSSSIANGQVIASELAVSETKITWQTAFINPGTWFVFAILQNGDITTVHRLGTTIEIDGAGFGDNRQAAIEFAVADNDLIRGNRALVTGGVEKTQVIKWKATDPDSDSELITSVYYSTDDGQTWVLIAGDLENDVDQVEWVIDAKPVRSARYRIKISAVDLMGNVSSYMSEEPFGVSENAVTYDGALASAINACNSCHNSSASPTMFGNLNMDIFAAADTGPDGYNDQRGRILEYTRKDSANPMPPLGGLSDRNRDLFWLWEKTGRKQN